MEGVPSKKFGNDFVNIVLEVFKLTYKHEPIDKKPRNEAHNFHRQIKKVLKPYPVELTTKRFRAILEMYFEWLPEQIGGEVQTINAARRHFKIYQEKLIKILEKNYGVQQSNEPIQQT